MGLYSITTTSMYDSVSRKICYCAVHYTTTGQTGHNGMQNINLESKYSTRVKADQNTTNQYGKYVTTESKDHNTSSN